MLFLQCFGRSLSAWYYSDMLETIELQTSIHTPNASVIWMHGLGADAHDFENLASQLQLNPSLSIRFIFPHAPIRPVSLNGGMKMRAWYDIFGLNAESREDEKGLWETHKQIAELIEQEHLRGIARNRIFLGGFSQGGAQALFTGLRYISVLGGIIGLSTYLPLAKKLVLEKDPSKAHFPIFLAHGTNDPVVPFEWGKMVEQILTDLDYSVEWHEYPIAHQLCAQEIVDMRIWLENHLLSK
jgi:phospholipase/carboxylesterase